MKFIIKHIYKHAVGTVRLFCRLFHTSFDIELAQRITWTIFIFWFVPLFISTYALIALAFPEGERNNWIAIFPLLFIICMIVYLGWVLGKTDKIKIREFKKTGTLYDLFIILIYLISPVILIDLLF